MLGRKTDVTLVAVLFAAAVLMGCAAGGQQAAAVKTAEAPGFERFHDIVDVNFVMQHVKVPMDKDVMIIDARPKRAKYDKGHIPMAVSIPDTYFAKMTDKLPANKDALLIFYCGGLKCPLSHKSAKKAEALGYTNVKVFAAGFPGWMKVKGNYASVSADWMKRQVDSGADMMIVDARPKRSKYDKGHIPGAVSIPDMYFEKMTDTLPADKNKMLVFYCGGLKCPLSHKSAKKALKLGYTNVRVFAGGYPAWKAVAGEQQATAAATAIEAGKTEGSIAVSAFKRILEENPGSIHIIDVRDPAEFKAGSFAGAKNIPVDKLMDDIQSVPTDKPVVFVCSTGARSGEAYYMMKDMRPEVKEVYYLEAEVTFNKDGSYEIKSAS